MFARVSDKICKNWFWLVFSFSIHGVFAFFFYYYYYYQSESILYMSKELRCKFSKFVTKNKENSPQTTPLRLKEKKAFHTRGKFKFSDSPGYLNFRPARSDEQFAPWGRTGVTIDSTQLTRLGEGYAKVLLVRHQIAGLIRCYARKVPL